MEVEFKKDLRHSYMIITKDESLCAAEYCTGILEHQTIEGILPLELRHLDNQVFYYYEITAKQNLINVLERTALTSEALRTLIQGLLKVMEEAYDYLLSEEDFVLLPEYIYLDIVRYQPYLCYLPGSSQNIRKQMSTLIEYLMNKIDYADKDAVLLVCQLYAVSREEEFTFSQLEEILQRDLQQEIRDQTAQKKTRRNELATSEAEEKQSAYGKGSIKEEPIRRQESIRKKEPIRRQESIRRRESVRKQESIRKQEPIRKQESVRKQESIGRRPDSSTSTGEDDRIQHYPVMKERIESETEVLYYPVQNLILSGICIMIGILITVLGFTTGILYNSFGNRLDYSKLLALLLIILCVESYILKKLLDKKNKISKVVKTCEYIDPRVNIELRGIRLGQKPKARISDDLGDIEVENLTLEKAQSIRKEPIGGKEPTWGKEQSGTKEQSGGKEPTGGKVPTGGKEQSGTKEQLGTKAQSLGKEQSIEKDLKSEGLYYTEKEAKSEIRKLMKYQEELPYEEDYSPTCLLNSLPVKKPYLTLKAIDQGNEKDILITEFPFFLGKLHKNMNYRFDKDVISRYHAKITHEGDQYFIFDLNSMNGSYVNGEGLQPYQKKEIKAGDEITFANIKYHLD